MSENNQIQEIFTSLQSEINEPCPVVEGIQNEETIEIPKNHLHKAVEHLTGHFHPMHLSTITADIPVEDGEKIHLLYHFWKAKGFSLLIVLDKNTPELETIIDLIPGADFYEREVAEMYGVHFTNREETPPLLLPDDWNQNPPMAGIKEE